MGLSHDYLGLGVQFTVVFRIGIFVMAPRTTVDCRFQMATKSRQPSKQSHTIDQFFKVYSVILAECSNLLYALRYFLANTTHIQARQ